MTGQPEPGWHDVPVVLHHIFISPGHNFLGHHGREADHHPIEARDEIECVAGCGLVGDRYFEHKPNYKGQLTLFDTAVLEQLRTHFHGAPKEASAMRRNLLLAGIDLNQLIGRRFRLGPVELEASEECRPCYWMDQAVAPGAEAFLKGRGGLRARILCSGRLRVGPLTLQYR